MYLDAFTLSALVDEFLDTLVGARIQDVLDVDDTGIGLEVYGDRQRRYLYLSADTQLPRIQLLDDRLRRGLVKPTQLGLLFRRYVEGGSIAHVSQPPWERIIQFDIHGPEGEVSIVVEPMERRSNLLLLQKGIILDCMRRVGPDENRYRLSLPAHEYKLPPPQVGKLDPTKITLAELVSIFEHETDPKRKTAQVLASRLLGISPLLAKEITFRASDSINQKAADVDVETIYDALQILIKPLAARHWQPGIVESDNRVEAYSVYPITNSPGWHPVPTLTAALTAYYGAPVGEEAYRAAKVPVAEAIQEAKLKLGAKLASLEKSMTDESEREILRQSGELILAYQYTLHSGQTELKAHYEPDEPERIVHLDSSLSPLENAQAYFARYDKAKRALEDVPRLIKETRYELQFLQQLETDLEFARSWPEIDEVQQVLQANGHWRGVLGRKVAGSGQSAPLKVVTADGFVIWIGRNSRQNELVTFGKGGGQDVWLHARAVPGAHVVVKFDGRPILAPVIEQAASLAAYYSARRSDGKVEVDVTRCLYVKKIKGAGQGMVTYRNEQTHTVVPRKETDFDQP
jgi:predicted ribosome quality control (RQC) complex YloA/Tae2 family protein